MRQIDAGRHTLWAITGEECPDEEDTCHRMMVIRNTSAPLPRWTRVGTSRLFTNSSLVAVDEKDKVWTVDFTWDSQRRKVYSLGTQDDPYSPQRDPTGSYTKSNTTDQSRFTVVGVGKAGVWAITRQQEVMMEVSGRWRVLAGSRLVWIAVSSHVWGVDTRRRLVFRRGVTKDTPRGTAWVRVGGSTNYSRVDTWGEDVWALDTEGNIYRRDTRKPGNTKELLIHVSVGPDSVYGVNSRRELVREVEGVWSKVDTPYRWRLVDVGGGEVWGVDTGHRVFYWSMEEGEEWKEVEGRMVQVVVTDSGVAWGVDPRGRVVVRRRDGGWKDAGAPRARVVAAGSAGVWVVGRNHEVYFRRGSPGEDGGVWIKVDGILKWISSNTNVWGIGTDNRVFIREGVTEEVPEGVEWKEVDGRLTQVDAWGEEVRGVVHPTGGSGMEWAGRPAGGEHCTTDWGIWRSGESWVCGCNGCWCSDGTTLSTTTDCSSPPVPCSSTQDCVGLAKELVCKQDLPGGPRTCRSVQI